MAGDDLHFYILRNVNGGDIVRGDKVQKFNDNVKAAN